MSEPTIFVSTAIPGKTYDVETLTVLGWTEGDGSGHEGYHVRDYFDASGRYLGPDPHGIEPIFDAATLNQGSR